MNAVRLSALHTGRLYLRKHSWYSFLLEAESTPGPQYGRKDYVNEKKSNDTIWNRTRDLSAYSAVPQLTAPPAACPTQSKSIYNSLILSCIFVCCVECTFFFYTQHQITKKFTNCKGIKNNTNFRQITGIQDKLDTTCKQNAP